MSTAANGSVAPGLSRSERPRLLPFNRRLRHLHGISLRNLNLGLPHQRTRQKSIDDEAIPFTLKSTSKLLTVSESESAALTASHSVSDPRLAGRESSGSKPQENGARQSRRSSHSSSVRAKPTLQRSNTGPRQRQQAFKDIVTRRVANVFLSLHSGGEEEPIYISEMMADVMNPDFRCFDLNEVDSSITRQDNLVVKVWAQATDNEQWSLLVELSLSLQSLQYIGNSLENFHHPMPDNAVLFHLSDGIYTSFTDLAVDEPSVAPSLSPSTHPSSNLELTSSYDALMRLSTLDQCIRDSIATSHKLAADITKLISAGKLRATVEDSLVSARDHLSTIQRAVTSERRQVKATMNKLKDLRKSLGARRTAIQSGSTAQDRTRTDLIIDASQLQKRLTSQKETADGILGQRRRIAEDLLTIYPINPLANQTLAFTIRGLALTNSVFMPNSANPAVVAAALGYVAQVIHLLSFYLSVPLPYPLRPSSSSSSIVDTISLMAGSRHFPLWIKGSVFYRFEYAVFLLNKDIELLAEAMGLKVLDIRQTLPNLKYVMFVATAGRGELPGRKAGGVRGLVWKEKERSRGSDGGCGGVDEGKGSLGSSRRASWDSDVMPPGTATATGGLRSIATLRLGG